MVGGKGGGETEVGVGGRGGGRTLNERREKAATANEPSAE